MKRAHSLALLINHLSKNNQTSGFKLDLSHLPRCNSIICSYSETDEPGGSEI